jgi:hypothetical protein
MAMSTARERLTVHQSRIWMTPVGARLELCLLRLVDNDAVASGLLGGI